MNKLLFGLAVAAVTALAAGNASAAQLSAQDRAFLEQAQRGNYGEIQAGQLVEQKGATPRIKQLGQMLVQDHEQLGQQMQQFAQQNGVDVPQEPTATQARQMQALQKLNGRQFDRTFLRDTVQDHQHDIREYQQAASRTQDPEMKQLIGQALPVLRKHLQMARQDEKTG